MATWDCSERRGVYRWVCRHCKTECASQTAVLRHAETADHPVEAQWLKVGSTYVADERGC